MCLSVEAQEYRYAGTETGWWMILCGAKMDVGGGGVGEGGDVACNRIQTDIDGLRLHRSLKLGLSPSSPKLPKQNSLVKSTGCVIRVVF